MLSLKLKLMVVFMWLWYCFVFEDDSVVKGLQDAFPAYATNFPVWSMHTSAMHQLAVWTMLEDAGLGASLQHYNPIIDEEVAATWHLPASWKTCSSNAVWISRG